MLQKFLYFLCLLAISHSAFATESYEHINNFQSHITVNVDASIDVTEEISVYANNDRIIHGIVRYLPTRYTDSYGIHRSTRYQITGIYFNGKKSAYHTENANNQLAIYIGERDATLSPGNYNYTIRYHVNNAVNFLRDADEVYWNITGNSWAFPIDKVKAIIQLPMGANILNSAAYTGAKGARGKNYVATRLSDNQMSFATNSTLPPGEGLTVAVAWQKGIVHTPTWWEWFIQQFYTVEFFLIEMSIVIFIYYFYVWYLHGRGPKSGTIVPLYEPPDNLTPEAMRYIARMGFDSKTFSAAIVNLAANGYLTIENKHHEFTLTKTNKAADSLAIEESDLLDQLFSEGLILKISQDNHQTMQDSRAVLKEDLAEKYIDKYFITNRIYLIPGCLLTLFAIAISILLSGDAKETAPAMFWLGGWTFACSFLLVMAFNAIQLARSTRAFVDIGKALFMCLFITPFLVGEFLGIIMLSDSVPLLTVPILFFLIVLNFVFYHILKAPTLQGRKLMDKIAGFKLFFTTTERYRIQQMYPGNKLPEIFEKYLPYAIALDVESEWAAQFDGLLRSAGINPDTYHPSWYSGSSWSTRNLSALPVALGAGLASSLASASSSTSSSASGGGGSSGGGGGGGGGGGW